MSSSTKARTDLLGRVVKDSPLDDDTLLKQFDAAELARALPEVDEIRVVYLAEVSVYQLTMTMLEGDPVVVKIPDVLPANTETLATRLRRAIEPDVKIDQDGLDRVEKLLDG